MRSLIQRRIGAFSLFLAFVLTFSPELVLVERKYSIFRGGFGQPLPLNSATELAIFFGVVTICHLLVLSLFYLLVLRLHPKDKGIGFTHYNFVFFSVTLAGILLAIKFKVLSYFSDAISFQLIRSLGGGSFMDALLYVADEAGMIITVSAVILALYWLGVRLFYFGRQKEPEKPIQNPSIAIWSTALGALAIMVSFMLYALNDAKSIRLALDRFYSFKVINSALAELTDFDRDGYSFYTHLTDPFPFDSSRYPLALDIPGNGIDEDGFAGDFVYDEKPVLPMPRINGAKKNLVLIVLESTRADALGKFVDGIEVSPHMNNLAKNGTSVQHAYSHVGFTSPSLKSLFSGDLNASGPRRSVFRDLRTNGYQIGVFFGPSETFGGISKSVGMKVNSDIFVDAAALKTERAFAFAAHGSLRVDGQILLREFDRRIGSVENWDKPTFLYFNFQSAHFPYHHEGLKNFIHDEPIPRSKTSKSNKEWVRKTYWNAVAYGDWLVGQVISRLKNLGVYENTVVVVTSDHGESLFDDGFLGHGHMINLQQTQIPLIINQPGIAVHQPLGLNGYYGLMMNLLGAEGPYKNLPMVGAEKDVFQYIGHLDNPNSIGLIEVGGWWTVLNIDKLLVSFKDLDRVLPYGDLKNHPLLKARFDRLIFSWERQRWESRLTRRVERPLKK